MYCICTPGEEEIEADIPAGSIAECVDPVRCKQGTTAERAPERKAASLGAGMLLQKIAMDLTEGIENTGYPVPGRG